MTHLCHSMINFAAMHDVLADGVVIGRIFKANAAAVGASWMWTLVFGHHEEPT
jgi:hypothetical protein